MSGHRVLHELYLRASSLGGKLIQFCFQIRRQMNFHKSKRRQIGRCLSITLGEVGSDAYYRARITITSVDFTSAAAIWPFSRRISRTASAVMMEVKRLTGSEGGVCVNRSSTFNPHT